MIEGNDWVQDRLENGNIERKLAEIIAQASFTRVPADDICLTDMLSDIGIDSLAFMEVVVCVEEEFGIVVADEDLAVERFDTAESLKSYILSKMALCHAC